MSCLKMRHCVPAGALASMRLELAAGHHLVAAFAQYARLSIQARLDAYLSFQQYPLLRRPVLYWLPILHPQPHASDHGSMHEASGKRTAVTCLEMQNRSNWVGWP